MRSFSSFDARTIHSKCLVYDTWTKEIESMLGAIFAGERLANPIRVDIMLIMLVLSSV